MNVSVIIPAYNAAATLAQSLESLLLQTMPAWEAIVVDDGSTDLTATIAGDFAQRDSRIRMVSQSNAGESAARNAGIAEAHYDWLLFLDADDWIASSHLERLTAVLEADPNVDAVHCGWARVTGSGVLVANDYRPPAGDLFPVLARRAAFPIHACIVRKSLVDEAGRFDTSLRTSPDWDLWQRIARGGARFGSVPEVLAFYRMSPHSASLDAERLLRDGITVLKRGHSPDGRVPNPVSDYADGLPGSTVESQEFYLLCWSAGLSIGSGLDARPLLRVVCQDANPGLHADAVAQCIFESAPLPNCLSLDAWEDLWPRVNGLAASFLDALEEQSQATGLASKALTELKRLILKTSAVWGPVIAQGEQTSAGLRDTIAQFVDGTTRIEAARDNWRRSAEEAEYRLSLAETELENSRRSCAAVSGERDSLSSALRGTEYQLAAAQTELENSQRSCAAVSGERDSLSSALRGTEDQLAAARTDLENSQRSFVAVSGERDSLSSALRGTEDQLAAARTDLENSQRSFVAVSGERDSLSSALRGTEDQLAAARTDLENSQRSFVAVSGERDSLSSALRGTEDQLAAARTENRRLETVLLEERSRSSLLERERRLLEESLDESRRCISAYEGQVQALSQDLEEARRNTRALGEKAESVAQEADKWRQSAVEHARLIEEVQQQPWMRVGYKLRMAKRCLGGPDGPMASHPLGGTGETVSASGEETALLNWDLRVAEGSEARPIQPTGDARGIIINIKQVTTQTAWDVQLNLPGLKVSGGERYTVVFQARAERPRAIGVGFAKAYAPWSSLGLYNIVHLRPEWQTFREEFAAFADDENGRIHFDLGGKTIGVHLSSVTFERIDEPGDPPAPTPVEIAETGGRRA